MRLLVGVLSSLALLLGPVSLPASSAAEPVEHRTASVAAHKQVGPSEKQLKHARQKILRDTNRFRAKHGKRPLKLMPGLNKVAQKWSMKMAKTGDFKHNPNVGSQIPKNWHAWGENIAAGHQPKTVVQAWIDSPGHRANLLGDFTHLGVGYVPDGKAPYRIFTTQNFGKYPKRR